MLGKIPLESTVAKPKTARESRHSNRRRVEGTGLFITIDGIDGAGKTTLASGLATWIFQNFGSDVLLTKEPTKRSPWSKKLRSAALSERMSRERELEFFHKDRLWHLKHVVLPALQLHQVVICDRYVDSTLAYQADNAAEADALFKFMRQEIAVPDITFILDCPVDICLERIAKRNQPITSFEKRATLEKARTIFASRNGTHYRLLDGSKPPAQLQDDAQSSILALVEASNGSASRRGRPKAIDPKASSFTLLAAVA